MASFLPGPLRLPELAATSAAALSTLTAVLAVIKKGLRLMKAITPIFRLLFLSITAVEIGLGSKTGPEKKAAVISRFEKDIPPIAAELGASAGVVDFLVNPSVLGFIIDLLVDVLNATGALKKLEELRAEILAWIGISDQEVGAVVSATPEAPAAPAAEEAHAEDPTTPPAVAS